MIKPSAFKVVAFIPLFAVNTPFTVIPPFADNLPDILVSPTISSETLGVAVPIPIRA